TAVVRRLRELYRERREMPDDAAVDHARCIEEAVALTQPRWKNQARGNGVMNGMRTDVGALPIILGDPAAVREMLTNLILNAVDAMPKGGTIAVTAHEKNNEIRLEVRDSGTGMTEEVRRRCLEPFYSTKGQQGTGLGLALVQATVDRHHGTLTLESEPGRGTAFIMTFPVLTKTPASEPERVRIDRARRLRVLVVEDDPLVRAAVIEQLSGQGHTVETANNGLEGLDKFLSGQFDLVVTDRAMPEMGGDQLAIAIKQVAPDRPIIMLTGFGDLMDAKGEKPVGVDVVVGKPVTFDALQDAILQVVTRD
ncbi:MAG: ATP-binding protein, partial [Myxococcota bacterium]